MTSVSYSEAKVWHSCEKMWTFTYGMGLSPVGGSVSEAVAIGHSGHKFLETYFRCIKNGLDHKAAIEEITKLCNLNISGPNLKAFTATLNYIDRRLASEPLGRPIMVEEKIRTPEIDGIQFTFVPDLVWEYLEGPWKGQIAVEDFKFVQRRWSESAISMYRQIPLYINGLQENGYPTAKKGVLWFINRDTGIPQRRIVTPTKEELRGFVKEHLKTAQRIKEFRRLSFAEMNEKAIRTSNTDQCQKCYFVFPCKLELGGGDITKTLRSGYQEYKRPE